MDENYLNMMRQSLKMSGMSDEQIEATLAMQQQTMQAYANVDMSALQNSMQDALAGISGMDTSKMADLLNSESYFEFSENPSINRSYQWAVACGADLCHLRADIINDLTTGTDKETCLETLSEQWGIDSRADFIKMADSLKAGRHSAVYGKLAQGIDVPDFEEEKENLEEARILFKKDGLANDTPNMLIWDLGRLINIARFAFDAGLIDRKTALAYLKDAALLVKDAYKSWKELSVGYQFGRAVWGGIDEEYETLTEGMEQLLTEEDSPWVTLPFDLPLSIDE
jgi:hypothetical protein